MIRALSIVALCALTGAASAQSYNFTFFDTELQQTVGTASVGYRANAPIDDSFFGPGWYFGDGSLQFIGEGYTTFSCGGLFFCLTHVEGGVVDGFEASGFAVEGQLVGVGNQSYSDARLNASLRGGQNSFYYSIGGQLRDGSPFSATYQGTIVAAVPEPGTYALLLAGLGIVGFAARSRRR